MFLGKTHAVKDVVESMEYEFRVAAVNQSGVGEFSNPSEFVFARDPKSRFSTCFQSSNMTYNSLTSTLTMLASMSDPSPQSLRVRSRT